MKDFEMDGYKIRLKRTRYANNNTLAILADYFDEEMCSWLPYMDVTTNIDYPGADETKAFVNINMYGKDVAVWLSENGIATPTGKYGYSGFNTYALMEFNKSINNIPEIIFN